MTGLDSSADTPIHGVEWETRLLVYAERDHFTIRLFTAVRVAAKSLKAAAVQE